MGVGDPIGEGAVVPVFVVGMARSGTTWVYELLTAHPLAGGVLESHMFSPTAGLGALFGPLHWRENGSRYGLSRLMEREELVRDVRDLAGRWLTRGLAPSQRVVVEKTPGSVRQLPVVAEVFPEARFVVVLRDGRDVAVSIQAATGSWGPGFRRGYGGFAHTAPAVAHMWRRLVLEGRRVVRELGERAVEVRYEELRVDPLAGLRRLYGHCGLPHDEATLARAVEEAAFEQHAERGEQRFRRAARVGDWRARLSLPERIAFEVIAGDALRATGYERSSTWWLSP
jgi:hypothetical protein